VRLLDAGRGTSIAPRLAAHERSQWLDREALERLQLERLNATLAWARRSVPRYRELALPVPVGSLADIATWPVVTKADMRSDPDAFRPEALPAKVFTRRTGGSTGDPFVYTVDAAAFSEQWAAAYRAWAWTGWTLGRRMTTVGGGSVNPDGGQSVKQRVYNLLRANRPLPIGSLDDAAIDGILASLVDLPPVLLYGYPSILYALGGRVGAESRRPQGIRAVMTTSETLFPGQRQAIAEAFGAPVFDMYGCNEANLVTCECDRHAGLHVGMEASLVEIVDDDGRAVPDGTPGRIVATGLLNRAMPVIRYDTGDRGALDRTPCACGRGLIRISGLDGRSRDVVRAADGRLVHGVVFDGIALAHPWIDRYQAIQEDASHLTVRLAVRGTPPPGELAALADRFHRACGLEVHLGVGEPFETTPGMKTRVVISRLEAGR